EVNMPLGPNQYVRVGSGDYSIHTHAIGHQVTVVVATQTVSATCNGTQVAWHPRCCARHQPLTDPAHAEAARLLRGEFLHARAAAAAAHTAPAEVEVEQRALTAYDRMFTVIDGGAECDGAGHGGAEAS